MTTLDKLEHMIPLLWSSLLCAKYYYRQFSSHFLVLWFQELFYSFLIIALWSGHYYLLGFAGGEIESWGGWVPSQDLRDYKWWNWQWRPGSQILGFILLIFIFFYIFFLLLDLDIFWSYFSSFLKWKLRLLFQELSFFWYKYLIL